MEEVEVFNSYRLAVTEALNRSSGIPDAGELQEEYTRITQLGTQDYQYIDVTIDGPLWVPGDGVFPSHCAGEKPS